MAIYDRQTALIVVDVQNDFATPEGSLYVSGGEKVVPLINEEIEAALSAGAAVFYTQDWHPPSTPHFAKHGGLWPVHCVAGTKGASFHPDLRVEGEIMQKGNSGADGYSGFTVRDPVTKETSPTPLEGLLRARSITKVVVCGLATDYCVKETAIDGARLGFDVDVLEGAIAAVNLEEGDGDRALEAMQAAGATLIP
jgi:nicotinamidase/pyrazinamidase